MSEPTRETADTVTVFGAAIGKRWKGKHCGNVSIFTQTENKSAKILLMDEANNLQIGIECPLSWHRPPCLQWSVAHGQQ